MAVAVAGVTALMAMRRRPGAPAAAEVLTPLVLHDYQPRHARSARQPG